MKDSPKELPPGKPSVPQTRDIGVEAAIAEAQASQQAKYVIGMKYPRNETRLHEKILEWTKVPEYAEKFYYSYPRSNKDVIGGSIILALEIARIWGNIELDRRVVNDELETRTIRATVIDFETNFHSSSEMTFKKLIQRKDPQTKITKWVVPDERDLLERQNALFARLTRNCMFEAVGRLFISMVIDKALETFRAHIKKGDIALMREKLIKEFGKLAIYQNDLEKYLNHPFNISTPEEIAELQGILNSIREGITDRNEYFGPESTQKGAPSEKEEGMTLDQVINGDLKQEGPTTEQQPPSPKPEEKPELGDDRILEEFMKKLAECTKPISVVKYLNEVKANTAAMRLSRGLLEKITTLGGNETIRLFKKDLMGMATAIDVQKYMRESGIKGATEKAWKELWEQLSKLANDRMRDLLKKKGP